eukprot:4875277-Pleurochrysis_carterae.AAC.2
MPWYASRYCASVWLATYSCSRKHADTNTHAHAHAHARIGAGDGQEQQRHAGSMNPCLECPWMKQHSGQRNHSGILKNIPDKEGTFRKNRALPPP